MTQNPGIGRLIAMLALSAFSASLVTRIADPLVAVLARDLNATTARVALLASAFALPFSLIQPILGPVGDALGKQRVIACGLALLAVFLLLSAFATSLDSLLVLRALAGLAAGGVTPLSIALVADSVPAADRQVALSRLLAFTIAGQIAGGSLAGLLEPFLGWRGIMVAASALAASAMAAILLGGRGVPGQGRRNFDPMLALRHYRQLLAMPAARVLYVSVAVEGGLVFGCFPYIAPFLASARVTCPLPSPAGPRPISRILPPRVLYRNSQYRAVGRTSRNRPLPSPYRPGPLVLTSTAVSAAAFRAMEVLRLAERGDGNTSPPVSPQYWRGWHRTQAERYGHNLGCFLFFQFFNLRGEGCGERLRTVGRRMGCPPSNDIF